MEISKRASWKITKWRKKTIKSRPDQPINKNSCQLTVDENDRTVNKNDNSVVYSVDFGDIRMDITKRGRVAWGDRALLRC